MNFLTTFFTSLQPHRFFAVCATVFGLMFLVLTPPFQTPDEINHFYRAYQISEGTFLGQKQDNRVGGDLPKSLVEFADAFRVMTWTNTARTTPATILRKFDHPLNPQDKQFVDFANTAMYSPVSYAPQAAVLYYLKTFELSPVGMFYWARLITLLFWIVSIYYAIRMMPFYKWLFALIALLPMSVLINMSISADVVTNALAFLSVAYGCKLAYKESAVSAEQFSVVCLLTFLLTSAKIVYAPVLLVVLLIPKEKFGTTKEYVLKLSQLGLLALVTACCWSAVMKNLYTPYSQYNEAYRNGASIIDCADMYGQIDYILTHGWYLLDVFIHSLIQSRDMYYQGFIGTFGWLDTYLPVWFVFAAYVILVIVSVLDGTVSIQITRFQKGILLLAFALIVFLILLTQHLTWDCVGGDIIYTIQGRYFIPAAPLLFLLFYNRKFIFPAVVIPLVVVFSVFSLSLSAGVLYDRYFNAREIVGESIVVCNAEETMAGNLFKSNVPNEVFENANTQSNEKAMSGAHAVKLKAATPFSFTHRIHDAGAGDQIKVEVWRFGKSGKIVLSNDNTHLHVETSDPVEYNDKGWGRLELIYTSGRDFYGDEIAIYLYNDQDSSYFDDMRVTHLKFK